MSPFTEPVTKSLTTDESTVASDPKNHAPLLSQEEIDDEQPSSINMTAVVCTAIVAICATIILCVAKPWRSGSDEQYAKVDIPEKEVVTPETASQPATTETKKAEAKPAEQKTLEVMSAEQKPTKTEPVKPVPTKVESAGLPVVPVTTTGNANPYNNIRLIDASSRKLTKAEVALMSKAELALARNAIYARHGYVYKNAELGEFFSKQSWFKPNKTLKLEDVKAKLSEIEVANINTIIAQEKK